MHLEGPFISPMRLGAHPKLNLEPRGEAFERVMALEHLKLITLAPELPGALDAIRRLTSRGVVVSIGHTNATFEEADGGNRGGRADVYASVQCDAPARVIAIPASSLRRLPTRSRCPR